MKKTTEQLLIFSPIILCFVFLIGVIITSCTDTTAQPSNPSTPIAGCEYTAEMVAEDIYLKHKVDCNNH